VSGGIWEAVEASTREVGMGETERRRSEGGSREKERGKREKEETKEGKNSRRKESSGGVGDMG